MAGMANTAGNTIRIARTVISASEPFFQDPVQPSEPFHTALAEQVRDLRQHQRDQEEIHSGRDIKQELLKIFRAGRDLQKIDTQPIYQ